MNSYNIVTLDTEVSIHNTGDEAIGKNKASPYHPANKLVMVGYKTLDTKVTINADNVWQSESKHTKKAKDTLMIGHNIKFDLHWLMREDRGFREYIWPHIQIWDTMLAEYILTGQTSQFASLDKVSEKYGGTLKDDSIKEFWDSGVSTEDIPEEMLEEYLIHDVENTELVFKEQLRRAKELGMLELIKVQMRALKATTEMEWNGMQFDKDVAEKAITKLRIDKSLYEQELEYTAAGYFPENFMDNWTPYSAKQIATLLFGGKYKVKVNEVVKDEDGEPVVYKTGVRKGEIKRKKVEIELYTSGFGLPVKEKYKTDSGNISTSDAVLKDVLESVPMSRDKENFIDVLLHVRKIKKDLSTYFEGYKKLVWPDGKIHHTLNHVGTDTGRLSSSNPNLQNVTSKKEE